MLLYYCIEVWSGTSDCNKQSVSKLQKKTVNVIESSKFRGFDIRVGYWHEKDYKALYQLLVANLPL